MSQDSSLVDAFDLNSQTGVMSILASIRGSKLSAPEKNELRDLVFLYTNGGGDASVRLALEQKLATHQIVPVSVRQAVQAGPALAFGSYRPTPTFRKTPQVATAPAPVLVQVPTPAPVAVAPTAVAPQPMPMPMSMPAPVAVSVPITNMAPAPTPVAPVPVIPQPPVLPESVVAEPAPMPAPVPNNTAPGEANYIERIRQIKTAVNSKVGNPVNLVDINNEVGREYMNALLEAMKKLSSGAVSEMDPAMSRLETAYVAVEAAIAGHNAPAPTPTPAMTTMTAPAALVVPIMSAPVMPVMPEMPISVPMPAPAPLPVPHLPPRAMPPVPAPEPLPIRVEEPVDTGASSGFAASTEVPPANEVIPQPTSFALSDRQKILTPQDLPEASAVSTSSTGDPLFTKEVDDGLNQLLSDWTLFRKSGLFGTGPKGREHPLFKKIADLQVPLLLAGRFDGATQEIRQSITDYMNGWRYEQGIIYQPGETFEKYLRRVIKHIISLQKKHKQP